MKNNKTPIRIGLQFFALDGSAQPTAAPEAIGDAEPATENIGTTTSADTAKNGNQLEEEFEKLIKGGRFENAFKKRTQGIIDKRFKTLKSLEESRAKQQPLLDFLSEKYGVDSSDPELMLQKMQNEQATVQKEKMGDADTPVESLKKEIVSKKADLLYRRWTEEGEQLKRIFPEFDFGKELKDPAFSSLLKSGMPVRKAYTMVHSDELLKNAVTGTAKKVAEQTLKSIRAQGSRVAENGLHNGAGIVRKTDVSSLTGQEIRDILKQVENGSRIRF